MSETHKITLLPCPWCGSDQVTNNAYVEGLDGCEYDTVQCKNCHACGPGFKNGDAKAVSVYNYGPYVDRFDLHQFSLRAHAAKLTAEADRLRAKAAELESKVKEAASVH